MSRSMVLRLAPFVLFVTMAMTSSCTRDNPSFCLRDADCAVGQTCDTVAKECRGGPAGGAGGDAGSFPDSRPGDDGERVTDSGTERGGDSAIDGPGSPDSSPDIPGSCGTDDDCVRADPNHPICENRTCIGCATATQCTSEKPICGTNHRCAACSASTDCQKLSDPSRAVCDAPSGRCVQCTASSSCSSEAPICSIDRRCAACKSDMECGTLGDSARAFCDTAPGRCVQCLANTSCSAEKPICGTTRVCSACQTDAECKTLNDSARAVCDKGNGRCVECTSSANCTGPAAPICDIASKRCTKCSSDAQCADKAANPGVCLDEGRCATEAETIFVENKAGCSAAGGTAVMPVCSLADAGSKINVTRPLLLVRGGVDGALVISSIAAKVTMVGQKGSSGDAASIQAISGSAVRVTGGELAMRDLSVAGGNVSSTASVEATGSSARLSLLRLKVAGAVGVGVKAASGAHLTMDKSLLENNTGGGLIVDGAGYAISNSIITGSAQFASGSPASSRFVSNTIVGVVSCVPSSAQSIVGSIVTGTNVSCNLTRTISSAVDFDPARPYHLKGSLPCPGGDPTPFPPDDIDGEIRKAPIDCGADQYVP
jgi:hypothetical protein